MLGENILKLRKKQGLSQEELGESVGVTRQTISNWELNETSPNPEQLKLLSKSLNISVDELLNNEIKSILEEKVSNTERLAGIIIKILKVLGIILALDFIIFIICAILFTVNNDKDNFLTSMEFTCSLNDKTYKITVDSNNGYDCYGCSDELFKTIGNLTKTNNPDDSVENIAEYFRTNGGSCE